MKEADSLPKLVLSLIAISVHLHIAGVTILEWCFFCQKISNYCACNNELDQNLVRLTP